MNLLQKEISHRRQDQLFYEICDEAVVDDLVREIDKLQLFFNESVIGLFANHILMMLLRIKREEQIKATEDFEGVEQISDESQIAASELMKTIEFAWHKPVKATEKYLLSVYIEMGRNGEIK